MSKVQEWSMERKEVGATEPYRCLRWLGWIAFLAFLDCIYRDFVAARINARFYIARPSEMNSTFCVCVDF